MSKGLGALGIQSDLHDVRPQLQALQHGLPKSESQKIESISQTESDSI